MTRRDRFRHALTRRFLAAGAMLDLEASHALLVFALEPGIELRGGGERAILGKHDCACAQAETLELRSSRDACLLTAEIVPV